jgi:hypothetical protein
MDKKERKKPHSFLTKMIYEVTMYYQLINEKKNKERKRIRKKKKTCGA